MNPPARRQRLIRDIICFGSVTLPYDEALIDTIFPENVSLLAWARDNGFRVFITPSPPGFRHIQTIIFEDTFNNERKFDITKTCPTSEL